MNDVSVLAAPVRGLLGAIRRPAAREDGEQQDEAASQLQKERPQRLLEVVEQELVSRGESSSP